MRRLIGAAFALVCAASVVQAGPINGGFETGNFSGWTTTGTTSVVGTFGGSLVPPAGSFQATMQTVPNGPPLATLATFLGTTPAALNALAAPGNITNGSAIRQSFTMGVSPFALGFGVVNQSDNSVNSALLVDDIQVDGFTGTLTFKWNFATDELDQAAAFNDFAFVYLNGTLVKLRDKSTGPFNSGPSGFDGNTGYQTFSIQLDSLKFAPEPASMLLFGGVLAAGGLAVRRRMKATA